MSIDSLEISITGTGKYVPEKILSNHDLEKMVNTSDEWIQARTGIKSRRIARDGETTSDLAVEAALEALATANLPAEKIGLIIVATTTPDMLYPSTACIVQEKIGATGAVCFDISAACSGYVYAQKVAESLMACDAIEHALVIGAEKNSSIVDWEDRNTCILFGDGAGAVILSKNNGGKSGKIYKTVIYSDGRNYKILGVPGSIFAKHDDKQYPNHKPGHIYMSGGEVFKQAVIYMKKVSEDVLRKSNLSVEDIDLFIPHQANKRIIDSVASRLNFDEEKIFLNLEKYGNTSAAAIPIALDEAIKTGKAKSGANLLLVAFGAGMTWGASTVKLP